MLELKHKLLLSKIEYLKNKLELALIYYKQGIKDYTLDLSSAGDSSPEQVSKPYTIEDMLKIPIEEVNIEFKKLYRNIALKTHPDKVKDSAKLDIYVKTVTAVEYDNWFDLIEIAKELNLEVPKSTKDQLEWLKLLVDILEKKLKILKSSVGWTYFTKTKEERKIFLENYINEKS